MDGRRGGYAALLATASAFALGGTARSARFREGEGEGAGGGGAGLGAASLLDDDAGGGDGGSGGGAGGSGGGGDGGGGDGGSGGGGDGGDGGSAPQVADWMKAFSGEAPEAGELSNQEWLAKTGVKDLDALAKRMRDTEKALRESGRVKIPGEDAKPEEVKAFREAMGVPEEAKGYEAKLPDGAEGQYELDTAFLDPLREIAHQHNVPAKAFEALAQAVMQNQLESALTEAGNNDAAAAAKVREWGADGPAKRAEFRRGAEILGLDKAGIAKIQAGFGVGETMDLLAKIGGMAGEDFFAGSGGSQKFGVASAEEAQRQLDAITGDPANKAKLNKNSGEFDASLAAKYNRLIDAAAHFREAEAKRR